MSFPISRLPGANFRANETSVQPYITTLIVLFMGMAG